MSADYVVAAILLTLGIVSLGVAFVRAYLHVVEEDKQKHEEGTES